MSKSIKNSVFVLGIAAVLLLQACNAKRFVPEGKLLYTGAEVQIETETEIADLKQVKSLIQSVIGPEPNSEFLGMRPWLLVHYKAQRENPGFINKFLNKKIGEEPVYLSDVDLDQNEKLISNRLENNGFFYSQVDADVKAFEEKKEAKVTYLVELLEPYKLEKYKMDSDSLPIYSDIKKTLSESLLNSGMRFQLPALKLERERIDRELKQQGYYFFHPGFLIFEADTNQYSNKKFDLFLRLKKDVPHEAIIPYRLAEVNVYPNYQINTEEMEKDTVRIEGINFIQGEEFFKPERLAPFILLEEGQRYDPMESRITSKRLTSIGTYKFVNIDYDKVDSLSQDSVGVLNANIYLSPLARRAVRAEIQAVTKSNGFAGPHLALTYSNRNLFHGGEILNITGKFGYEFQISGGDQSGLNSLQAALQTDLIFPRLLFPININENWFEYSIPKTKVGVGLRYLRRSKLYSLGAVSGSFGYFWNANKYVTHELDPISIDYVSLTNSTEEFETILDENPYLRSSFNQQFIAGLIYSYTYNEMVDQGLTHQFFLNTNFDIAGNTINLLSGSSGEEPKTFLGLEYAQYAKADVDFRYHLNLGDEQTIATRLFAGIGIPYGNSKVMPYTKQYYSGGPYSVRAFRTRSLGPGTYTPEAEDVSGYFESSGNLRLEANIEYRFPLISFLKGAVFADAGNVWFTSEQKSLPGGEFSSNFLNELGIGVGTGVRVDVQNFVIRFDLAFPLKDPALPEGERWTYNFSDPVLNFAIGYPF